MNTILNLVFGIIGGNVLAKLRKSQNLGFVWNTIIGLIGAYASSAILNTTGVGGNIASGLIGGFIALFIVNLIKKLFSPKK